MSLSANRTGLVTITKELAVNWKETREQWRDAKRDEFENKFLIELFDAVETAGSVIDQLDKLLYKIRTDCE